MLRGRVVGRAVSDRRRAWCPVMLRRVLGALLVLGVRLYPGVYALYGRMDADGFAPAPDLDPTGPPGTGSRN